MEELGAVDEQLTLSQGLSAGAISVVYQTTSRLGTVATLGSSADGRLALWQVIARVIEQGSRLSGVIPFTKILFVNAINPEETSVLAAYRCFCPNMPHNAASFSTQSRQSATSNPPNSHFIAQSSWQRL